MSWDEKEEDEHLSRDNWSSGMQVTWPRIDLAAICKMHDVLCVEYPKWGIGPYFCSFSLGTYDPTLHLPYKPPG